MAQEAHQELAAAQDSLEGGMLEGVHQELWWRGRGSGHAPWMH